MMFLHLSAQNMTGVVSDAETGECIPYASVVYKGHHVAVVADIEGRYSIARHNGWTITYSAVGYIAQDVTISEGDNSRMNIKLKPDNRQLKQVTIHAKRGRYSRKNNPAVELMKKVIAAKNFPTCQIMITIVMTSTRNLPLVQMTSPLNSWRRSHFQALPG